MSPTEARRRTATRLPSSGEMPNKNRAFEQSRDIDARIISRYLYVGL